MRLSAVLLLFLSFDAPRAIAAGAGEQTIRKLRFVTPDVAVVDIDTEVRNVRQMPGMTLPADGVLRTRLQQVLVKRAGGWWIEAAHNVAAKAPPAGNDQQAPAGAGK